MSNVNPTGLGSPIVKIFTSKNEIVERVVDFYYKHSEEADDECVIVLEGKDVNFPDKEEFQEGAKLFVEWGYSDGLRSKSRKVFVRDTKAKYTKESVKLILTCYDKFAAAKQTTSQKIHKDTDLDLLAKGIAEKNGLEYEGIKQILEIGDTVGLKTPAYLDEDTNHAVAVDNTSFPIRVDFTKYAQLPQGNKSDQQILREVADREQGGPWVIEGRDEELIVKKRNLLQKPIKTYTYKGGNFELLRFTPETKNRVGKSANVNIESAGWDAILKRFLQTNSNAQNVDDNYLGDEIDGSPRANPVVAPDEDDIENQDTPLDDGGLNHPDTGKPFDLSLQQMDTVDPAILKETGYTTNAIANTATVITIPVLDYSIHEDTIENELGKIKGYGDNRKANASLKKNPATGLMLGDPRVLSGKVITILNVSKKYSGNYYIIEIIHRPFVKSGYLMELKMVKNALGKSDTPSPDKIGTKNLKGIINKEVGSEVTEEGTNTIAEGGPEDSGLALTNKFFTE